jgi:predicted small metal-binding protein
VIVDKALKCECGFEARAADEKGLVDEVRRHAREAHGMTLSHDEALAIARDSTTRNDKEER